MKAHAIKMKRSSNKSKFLKTPGTSEENVHEGEDVNIKLTKLAQHQPKLVTNEVNVSSKLFNMKRGSAS